MSGVFPSIEWLEALHKHLNSDEKYAQIAKSWEGDIMFDILPSGALNERTLIYLDLWHGKCRKVQYNVDQKTTSDFILQASYDDFVRVLTGQLAPMTAMMTRKLKVVGSMAYMMRNVPTVLQFVRCAQDVTDHYLGE